MPMDTHFEQAILHLQTNVFIADKDLNLIFMNEKAKETLLKMENVLQEKFSLRSSDLLGINIDKLHGKRVKEVRTILGDKKNFPYKAEIKLGQFTLSLNINVILDQGQNISSYVVNWEEISDKVKFEQESDLFKRMVDSSPINTMMADSKGTLIYMNEASKQTLKKIEHLLPVKVDGMIGQNIDIFHKRVAQTRNIFSDPSKLPHRAKIKLGDEFLDLQASAIIDKNKNFLGPMASWELISSKVHLIEGLSKSVNELMAAAEQLLNISTSLSSAVEETSAQANTVSVASEEINAGVQSMSQNMDEMVGAIREITKRTNESSSMASDALMMAKSADQIINKLGQSSLDIGNVIKVISSIAQQTNLLALNATIEAARAGEAGRGFAVVANEVKELAKQTGKATQDITNKIEAIQSDSTQAVSAIGEISGAVEKLHGFAANIAAAVEEQAATTNEVKRVVGESAEGVKQINENIAQVSQAAANTGKDADRSQQAARSLSEMAERIKHFISKLET